MPQCAQHSSPGSAIIAQLMGLHPPSVLFRCSQLMLAKFPSTHVWHSSSPSETTSASS